MWKANNSALASALTKTSIESSEVLVRTTYVVDGAALLLRVYWNVPATYEEILMQYRSYLDKMYGKGCLIVFDGYKSGTKDQENQRRSKQSSIEVVFQLQKEVHCKQSNRSSFISFLNLK